MSALKVSQKKGNFNNKTGRKSVVPDTVNSSTKKATKRSISRIDVTDENQESITFIWLDPQEYLNASIIGSFRTINQHVQTFTDPSTCFNTIRYLQEKVFFITSSTNDELIATVHGFVAVEAIFILNPNGDNVKGDFPKVFGIFIQQEELFRVLKDVLQIFEQVQQEEFAFEEDPVFLWSQLWKEDLISRKVPSNRQAFLEVARQFYKDNPRTIKNMEELEKLYRPMDSINWCYRSPFPSRFLLHALRYHNKAQLSMCRFLFADAARLFRQNSKHKSSEQVYRGMKISSELLHKFEAHVGQVMCTSGLFPCTKSRTNALTLASLPTYRPDLLPVLFKIDCDPSALFTVLSNKQTLPTIVFDTCMAFSVVYVNRDSMSVIKLKTAGEVGKKIASEYLQKHSNETISSVLDELLKPSQLSTPPPPIEASSSPPPLQAQTPSPKSKSALTQRQDATESMSKSEEIKAREYVEEGNIDLALITYRRIRPVTARILNVMGQLCTDRKGDYDYALQCHQQALKLQESSGEDISDTLTHLGNVYHKRGEFDLALEHHKRAFQLREANPTVDSFAMACNLIGIADVYWALHQYSEAISNAERALALQEANVSANEASIGATLALLATVYQDTGDTVHAIEFCTRAILLLEHTVPKNSPILAELLYKLGTMQSKSEELSDALVSLERSVKIYRTILPQGHPDSVSAENELQHVIALCKSKKQKSGTKS